MVEIKMPNLGMTMMEGVVKQWFKQDGDQVQEGEQIAEVTSETGKLNAFLEAKKSGTLHIKVELDVRVECGGLIGTIE